MSKKPTNPAKEKGFDHSRNERSRPRRETRQDQPGETTFAKLDEVVEEAMQKEQQEVKNEFYDEIRAELMPEFLSTIETEFAQIVGNLEKGIEELTEFADFHEMAYQENQRLRAMIAVLGEASKTLEEQLPKLHEYDVKIAELENRLLAKNRILAGVVIPPVAAGTPEIEQLKAMRADLKAKVSMGYDKLNAAIDRQREDMTKAGIQAHLDQQNALYKASNGRRTTTR